MRITFVVERPTQFEVPFYRFAAADPVHRLRVLYTDPRGAEPVYDPELGQTVSWGMDLRAGYEHAVCPDAGALRRELLRDRPDLVLVNGYTQRLYVLAAALARSAGTPVGLRLDSALFATPPPRERGRKVRAPRKPRCRITSGGPGQPGSGKVPQRADRQRLRPGER